MAYNLATFPVSETIKLVASYLEELTACNDSLDQIGNTPFHAQTIPNIEILLYLQRIQKYCPITNECFIAIIIYMHRLMRSNCSGKYEETSTVDSYSVHRLLITGILLTSKFFSDVFFTNTRYAKVGGIQVSELNRLELHFLKSLKFELAVSVDELQYYGDHLLNQTLPYNPPEEVCWLAVPGSSELPLLTSSSSVSVSSNEYVSPTFSTNASPGISCPPWSLHRLSNSAESMPTSPYMSTSPGSESLKSRPSSVTTTTLVSGLSSNSFHQSKTSISLVPFAPNYVDHFQSSFRRNE